MPSPSPLVLGLDTGGSFTDAALVDARGTLIAKAKAVTTPHDLSLGIARAIAAFTPQQKSAISRVALSTTLATNAVVEGTITPVGLLLIGFQPSMLNKIHLPPSPATPHVFITGGHHSDGSPQAPLDSKAIAEFAKQTKAKVAGYAIAGYFSTRNPSHETEAAKIIAKHSSLPVTLSHVLSSSLGGARRTATALLNARLIALLTGQIQACKRILAAANIKAEFMLVKGDGSLVAADFARLRPIETILSGPAASIAGATHLIKNQGKAKHKTHNAIVCDIGGTTTDIAVMEDGLARLSPHGAQVGGWATMVEAVDCHTHAIGGDSEVRLAKQGQEAKSLGAYTSRLTIGPRRLLPISVLAKSHPAIHTILDQQLQNPIASPSDGQFILPMPILCVGALPAWLSKSEYKLAQACRQYINKHGNAHDDTHGDKQSGKHGGIPIPIPIPIPIAKVAATRLTTAAIPRLHAHGLIRLAGFTPTDAVHVLGAWDAYDTEAATKSAALLARQKISQRNTQKNTQRNTWGKTCAKSAQELADATIQHWVMQSALAVYDSACHHLGTPHAQSVNNPIIADMLHARLTETNETPLDLIKNSISLTYPLIALGGGAEYYREVARVLGTRLIIPPHAEVAAAVGAAVSGICQRVSATITQPKDEVFRLHIAGGVPKDFSALTTAVAHGEAETKRLAKAKAMSAGAKAKSVVVAVSHKKNMVQLDSNRQLFIQAVIEATATSGAG